MSELTVGSTFQRPYEGELVQCEVRGFVDGRAVYRLKYSGHASFIYGIEYPEVIMKSWRVDFATQ